LHEKPPRLSGERLRDRTAAREEQRASLPDLIGAKRVELAEKTEFSHPAVASLRAIRDAIAKHRDALAAIEKEEQ
jgi:uncharacterized protein involved in exopolysaccharide biosynthesis